MTWLPWLPWLACLFVLASGNEGVPLWPVFDASSEYVAAARGRPVIFLHIHKSGGSTMCKLARTHARASPEHNCNLEGDFAATKKVLSRRYSKDCEQRQVDIRRENVTFMGVERFWDTGIYCHDRFYYLLTMRNPLGRLVSHRLAHRYRGTISELLDRDTLDWAGWSPTALNNFVVRTLLAVSDADIAVGGLGEEHLAQALSELLQWDLVITLEELNVVGFELIRDKLGWPLESMVHVNARKSHKQANWKTQLGREYAGYTKYNLLDLELYEYARYASHQAFWQLRATRTF